MKKHLRSKESFVQLYIYIISGKKVMELSDEAQVAGTHRLEIKGDTFSKGIYFCVLKTNPIRAGQYTKLIKY